MEETKKDKIEVEKIKQEVIAELAKQTILPEIQKPEKIVDTEKKNITIKCKPVTIVGRNAVRNYIKSLNIKVHGLVVFLKRLKIGQKDS